MSNLRYAIIFYGRIKHYEKKYLINNLSSENKYDIYYSACNENNIEEFKTLYNIPDSNICNDEIIHSYNLNEYVIHTANVNNLILHFINLKRALNLLINSNIKYDIIITTRFDLEIVKYIDINIIKEENTIYIPMGEDHCGINDRFAMGNYETMKKYCSIIDNCEYLCENKLSGAHPETLTLNNLKFMNINIERFDMGSNNIIR